MSIEAEIDRLESKLRLMKVEYDKFFCGALPIPPEPLRDDFKTALKLLRARGGKSSVDRFRLTNLEANFNSVNELLNRRIRNHEMGKAPRPGRDTAAPTPLDPRSGVIFGRQQDDEATLTLYKGLYEGRGSKATDLDTFKRYLSTQVERIRTKTGCASVQFRVAEENGKLKLKAKALKK